MNDRFDVPQRERMEEALLHHLRERQSRRPWWRRSYAKIAVVCLALTGVGVVATAMLWVRPPEPVAETTVVNCLERAERESDGSLSFRGIGVATPEGMLSLDDAVAACVVMWEKGEMTNSDPLNPSPLPGIVPTSFTTCVDDGGGAVVAPGRVFCSTLGLSPFQEGR